MPDTPSLWADASAVLHPQCPKCQAMDIEGAAPYIELVGRFLVCSVCAHAWPPAEPKR